MGVALISIARREIYGILAPVSEPSRDCIPPKLYKRPSVRTDFNYRSLRDCLVPNQSMTVKDVPKYSFHRFDVSNSLSSDTRLRDRRECGAVCSDFNQGGHTRARAHHARTYTIHNHFLVVNCLYNYRGDK